MPDEGFSIVSSEVFIKRVSGSDICSSTLEKNFTKTVKGQITT